MVLGPFNFSSGYLFKQKFLPTPSARRATTADALGQIGDLISTHALREEGDNCTPDLLPIAWNFYPRPPRGGRLLWEHWENLMGQFLPTPSARRATLRHSFVLTSTCRFLPTPSARRATCKTCFFQAALVISTHALREEGDQMP